MGFDFETRETHNSVDEHLARIDERLSRNRGPASCMVDLRLLGAGLRMANGDHLLAYVFRRLRSAGAHAVPVAERSSGRQQMQATKRIAAEDGHGACLRAGIEEEAGRGLRGRVDGLLGEAGVGVTACDIVLGRGAPRFEPLEDIATVIEGLIGGFPQLKRWRS